MWILFVAALILKLIYDCIKAVVAKEQAKGNIPDFAYEHAMKDLERKKDE